MAIQRIMLIIGAISLLLLAAYAYSLARVEVAGVTIDRLESVGMEGFTLTGEVIVHNSGITPVMIDGVEYRIVRADEVLGTGTVEGRWVAAGSDAPFPLRTTARWTPSAKLAYSIIASKDTNATVEGTIDIGPVDVPFEQEFDIGPYIRQFVDGKIQGAIDTVKGWFG